MILDPTIQVQVLMFGVHHKTPVRELFPIQSRTGVIQLESLMFQPEPTVLNMTLLLMQGWKRSDDGRHLFASVDDQRR